MTSTARRTSVLTVVLLVIAAVALLVVVVGGLLVYRALAGDGQQPEEVLPGDALAYVEIDLDPPAGQKVALTRLLTRLPELEDAEPDEVQTDVIREVVEGQLGLDYEGDVEPWLGQRLGVAVLDLDDEEPAVVLALQTTDAEAAQDSLLRAADDVGSRLATAGRGEYVLLAEDETVLRDAVDAADEGTLAEADRYGDDLDALGGDRVVTAWVDLDAVGAALRRDEQGSEELGAAGLGAGLPGLGGLDDLSGRVVVALRAAGDDVLELEARGRGLPDGSRLPADGDTAADLRAALGAAGDAELLVGLADVSAYLELLASSGLAELVTEGDPDVAARLTALDLGALVAGFDLADEAVELRVTSGDPEATRDDLREVLADLGADEQELADVEALDVEDGALVFREGRLSGGGAAQALDALLGDLDGDLAGAFVVTPEAFADDLSAQDEDLQALVDAVEAFGVAVSRDGDDDVYRARLVLR